MITDTINAGDIILMLVSGAMVVVHTMFFWYINHKKNESVSEAKQYIDNLLENLTNKQQKTHAEFVIRQEFIEFKESIKGESNEIKVSIKKLDDSNREFTRIFLEKTSHIEGMVMQMKGYFEGREKRDV